MSRNNQTTQAFSVNYSLRERDTNEDVKIVDMRWENRSLEVVIENLNTWLKATGLPLKVVQDEASKKA